MSKIVLFLLGVLLFTSQLEAQRCCWCGCRRYMDPAQADYDGNYYGYVDNLNYPDPYALPINYYFNYCPPCRCDSYNVKYLQNCLHYTNEKNMRTQRSYRSNMQ